MSQFKQNRNAFQNSQKSSFIKKSPIQNQNIKNSFSVKNTNENQQKSSFPRRKFSVSKGRIVLDKSKNEKSTKDNLKNKINEKFNRPTFSIAQNQNSNQVFKSVSPKKFAVEKGNQNQKQDAFSNQQNQAMKFQKIKNISPNKNEDSLNNPKQTNQIRFPKPKKKMFDDFPENNIPNDALNKQQTKTQMSRIKFPQPNKNIQYSNQYYQENSENQVSKETRISNANSPSPNSNFGNETTSKQNISNKPFSGDQMKSERQSINRFTRQINFPKTNQENSPAKPTSPRAHQNTNIFKKPKSNLQRNVSVAQPNLRASLYPLQKSFSLKPEGDKSPKNVIQDDSQMQPILKIILEEEQKFEKEFDEIINIWKNPLLSLSQHKEEFESTFSIATRFIIQSKQLSEKINLYLNIQKQSKSTETIIDTLKGINFELYSQWDQQNTVVHQIIQDLEKHNEPYRSVVAKCSHERIGQDFFHVLLFPLFYIRKFEENLKRLSSLIPPNTSVGSKISKILETSGNIIRDTNSNFWIFQKRSQLLNIQKQMGNSPTHIMESSRILNMHGGFKRVSRTKNYQGQYFMFNDMILLAKQKRKSQQLSYDICIFYSKSKIRDLSDDKKGQIQHAVEFLVEDNPERFICCFESEELKNQFWEIITSKLGISIEETSKTAQSTEEIIKKRKELSVMNNPIQQSKTSFQIEDFQGKTTDMNMRANVIQELVQTEEKYVKDLHVIIEYYLKPLREKSIVHKKDISAMFSSIETIFGVNSNILQELQMLYQKDPEKVAEMNVGTVFQKYVDFLKIYTQYCSNHPQSISTVVKYSKKDAFENFIHHQKENVAECGGLGILDLLIKPIQRICKYPLIFKELLKGTDPTYPDFQDLFKAYQALYHVAEYVNERQRSAEQSMIVVEILTRLAGIPKSFELVQPTRQFIQEATLKKKSVRRIQERQFWLFTDVIVYGKLSWTSKKKKYQYKGHLYLAESYVREITSEEFAFQIFPFGSKKGYTIYCNNEEQKQDWENKIKEQIKRLAELGIRPKNN
ncbi:faciogenital dysplasia protein [Anaeramoeba ignava]|uniref:Faciogenital dysplasia protein n=1 Tax=Anaeramoeba ignava TaxID=1746090 RepID=A0A9Q0L8V1_ANAIG|nr:faciogenital dysplasia protein [Anaeramoeba ignava]